VRKARARYALTRLALLPSVFVLCLVGACGARPAQTPHTGTRLVITVYPQGTSHPGASQYRLACGPARGTVPYATRACRLLGKLRNPFAAVPAGTICSSLALGPQEARVTGTVSGHRVNAKLTVRDSCEIERWRRLRAVVPGFPGR